MTFFQTTVIIVNIRRSFKCDTTAHQQQATRRIFHDTRVAQRPKKGKNVKSISESIKHI